MKKSSQKAVKYMLATHAVEHIKPSREAVRLCKQVASGNISADYAVAQIMRNYGIRRES